MKPWKKTVVRRLCSYLPLSIELADAVELESIAEGLILEAKLPEFADKTEPIATQEKVKQRLAPPKNLS